MALDELARHELHDRLREALGEEAAATLMGYLPPVGWADVATKRDLDGLQRDLEGQIALLKRDLDAQTALLKRDLDGLEERLGLRMDVLERGLRTELHREIAADIPNARLVIIKECGHLSTMERPAEVNAELRRWLSEE